MKDQAKQRSVGLVPKYSQVFYKRCEDGSMLEFNCTSSQDLSPISVIRGDLEYINLSLDEKKFSFSEYRSLLKQDDCEKKFAKSYFFYIIGILALGCYAIFHLVKFIRK
jgi:hypothetical protein